MSVAESRLPWGMDRAGLCKGKRQFRTQEFEGLKDPKPTYKSYPPADFAEVGRVFRSGSRPVFQFNVGRLPGWHSGSRKSTRSVQAAGEIGRLVGDHTQRQFKQRFCLRRRLILEAERCPAGELKEAESLVQENYRSVIIVPNQVQPACMFNCLAEGCSKLKA